MFKENSGIYHIQSVWWVKWRISDVQRNVCEPDRNDQYGRDSANVHISGKYVLQCKQATLQSQDWEFQAYRNRNKNGYWIGGEGISSHFPCINTGSFTTGWNFGTCNKQCIVEHCVWGWDERGRNGSHAECSGRRIYLWGSCRWSFIRYIFTSPKWKRYSAGCRSTIWID